MKISVSYHLPDGVDLGSSRKTILHKAAKEQLAKFDEVNLENKFSKLEHLKNPKFLK